MLKFLYSFFLISSLSLFLPLFFWWQVAVAQTSLVILHLCAFSLISQRLRKAVGTSIASAVVLTLCFFHYLNWQIYMPSCGVYESQAFSGMQYSPEQLRISFEPPQILYAQESFFSTEQLVTDLYQKMGSLAMIELTGTDSTIFNVAAVQTDQFISSQGWYPNKILLRRMSSRLRDREGTTLVVMSSDFTAISAIAKQFMFQARLRNQASFSYWKSLAGYKNTIYFGRGITFCRDKDNAVKFLKSD